MTLCNLLRVPFIFIVDELFKTSFGVPEFIEVTFSMNNTFVNSSFNQNEFSRSTQYYMVILLSFVKIIVSCLSKFDLNIFNDFELIILNFYVFSILFIFVFIFVTGKVLVLGIFTYIFCVRCTSLLLGKHTVTERFIRKL